ncbi:MAG: hypothetical protein OEO77_14450, partial [Acidimicrobiia bacterium]|nr:hypothetical protein [Acidimicrobiia bacterium]
MDRVASAGEAWVGPAGLLSILEACLGLGGPRESAALRAARLVPRVVEVEGFWSASARHNPLATARTLLRWRDRLWMQGWRGEDLAPRLGQLAAVTAGAEPGFVDRLVAVGGVRARAFGELEALELCEPRAEWAPAWSTVFGRLEAAGVAVRERAGEPVVAAGDLGRAQGALGGVGGGGGEGAAGLGGAAGGAEVAGAAGRAAGDGSLQLLRPYGPVGAAEEVAAWLGALPELAGTVVIGGDPVLDRALRDQGLPTAGAGWGRAPSALLQVLPLVLALGWEPADPQRAIELLTLPVCPVPFAVRRRLQDALREWPAVGSEVWDAGLAEGL